MYHDVNQGWAGTGGGVDVTGGWAALFYGADADDTAALFYGAGVGVDDTG